VCLAVPMRVTSIEGHVATCTARGIERRVSLFMLADEEVGVGDYVMVHVGYAIQRVAEQDAAATWQLLDEVLEHA